MMAGRAEPVGIDPALVRLTLAELAESYGARIAAAESGAERAAYLEAWALVSRRELDGLDTEEAAHLRALYSAVAEGARS